jgi:hypothetical protein
MYDLQRIITAEGRMRTTTGGIFDRITTGTAHGTGFVSGHLEADDYWRYVGNGRGPGGMPPVDNIRAWLERAGIAASPWAIAKSIAKREGVPADAPREGGLSGRPLRTKSTEILRHLYQNVRQRMVLIGVGGVFTAEDAYEKIRSGASLVQLYTGWIYGGPGAAARIIRGLVQLLRRDGFKNAQDAVGADL